MRCPDIRLLLLVYFQLIFFTAELSSKSSKDKWSWFEAQKICMNNNDTLKSNDLWTSTTDYWSGIYLRYSSRIHILGCYSADDSMLRISKKIDMKVPSVGFCQDICVTENIFMFGIQAQKCACFGIQVPKKILPPSECNETCNAENVQDVKFTECGGRGAYSVYMSERDITKKGTYCSSINCGSKKEFSFSSTCSELYFALCKEKEKLSSIETRSNWTQSMQFCKTLLQSSYLEGNISFVNASSTCEELNWTKDGFSWLGIITEIYYGNDRGVMIDEKNRASFHQCQKCNENGCSFDECSKQLDTILCENGLHMETTTQDIIYRQTTDTNVLKATVNQTNDRNVTNKIQGSITPNDSSTFTSIFVPLLTVFVLTSGIVIFIYIRKRKSRLTAKRGKFQKSKVKYVNNEQQNNENFTDMNYFVLEPTTSLSRNSTYMKEDLSNPYVETQEGTYDHLQDNDRRKEKKEKTYDHASLGRELDYGSYTIRKNIENIEDTYDHAGPSSDYGNHNKLVHVEQISGEYDKVMNILRDTQ